jgi:hypothetical protein
MSASIIPTQHSVSSHGLGTPEEHQIILRSGSRALHDLP